MTRLAMLRFRFIIYSRTLDLGELINRQQYSEWLKLNNVAEGVAPFANEGEIELRYKLQETKEGEDASVVAQRVADLPKHDVGGQEWENVQDPLLWQSLLEESVSIPGDEETFSSVSYTHLRAHET